MAVDPRIQDWLSRQGGQPRGLDQPDPYAPEAHNPALAMPPPAPPPPPQAPGVPMAAPQHPQEPAGGMDMASIARALESSHGSQQTPAAGMPPMGQGAQPDPSMYGRDSEELATAEERLRSSRDVTTGQQIANVLHGAFAGASGYDGPAWHTAQDRAQRDVELARKRLQESQQQDPNSPQSKRMRQLIAPLAEAAGIDPSVIESMSAADFGDAKDIGSILTTLQQRQVQMEQQRQVALEKRQMQLEDEQRKRGEKLDDAEEMERRLGPAKDRRAAMMGGQQLGRQMTMAQIQDEYARQRAQEAFERQQAARHEDKSEHREEKLEAKTAQYADKMRLSGLPGMESTLNELDAAIAEAKKANDGKVFTVPDEIIRRAGPDAAIGAMSAPARRVMQAWQKLMNAQIKEEAGAAVAKQEMERQKVAFGSGLLWGEQDFINGIKAMRRAVDADRKNLDAGFGPSVVEEYDRNLRGEPRKTARQQQPQQSDKVVIEKDGQRLRIPRARLQDAQRDGWRAADG